MRLTLRQKLETLYSAIDNWQKIKNVLITQYWRKHKTWEQSYGGVNAKFDTSDLYSNIWFYGFKNITVAHEPVITKIIIELARRSKAFLDVGANIGYYSILVKCANPEINVLAVELDETLKPIIEKNIALNRFKGIELVFGAVGNTSEPVPYTPHPFSFLARVYGENVDQLPRVQLKAPTLRIDEVLAAHDMQPDLVKIDIDGSEVAALKGASQMLASLDLVMLLEVHPQLLNNYGASMRELSNLLDPFGFLYYQVDEYRSDTRITLTKTPSLKDLIADDNPMFLVTRVAPTTLLAGISDDIAIQ